MIATCVVVGIITRRQVPDRCLVLITLTLRVGRGRVVRGRGGRWFRWCRRGSVMVSARVVGVEAEFPAFFVDDVVVADAQRPEEDEIGAAAAFPFDEVMDLALLERGVTAGDDAGAVHRPQGETLRLAGEAPVASVIELLVTERGDHAVLVDGGGDDRGVVVVERVR